MGISYSVGWGGFGRYDIEEFGLVVEDEVDSENDSSVGKIVKYMDLVWYLVAV